MIKVDLASPDSALVNDRLPAEVGFSVPRHKVARRRVDRGVHEDASIVPQSRREMADVRDVGAHLAHPLVTSCSSLRELRAEARSTVHNDGHQDGPVVVVVGGCSSSSGSA